MMLMGEGQTQAFRGELVPQVPNDEPASVLLERIKTQRKSQTSKPTSGRASMKKRIGLARKRMEK